MAKNTTPSFYLKDNPTITSFVAGDANNFKIIATGGADDSHVFEILIASNDTVARQIEFWKVPNNDIVEANVIATGFPLKISVPVPAGTGTTTLASDPLRLIQSTNAFIVERLFERDQNTYIDLPNGWYIMARMTGSVVGAGVWVKTQVKQKDF